jgi:hypothetical protein
MPNPAIKSKGAAISIGSAITGLISLDLPDVEMETFETDYLDNAGAGIPYDPTGRVEGGKISGEAWFGDTSYAALLALLKTTPFTKPSCTITLSNAKTITFTAAGISIGGSVSGKDGVKCKFGAKLDGLPNYA